MLERAEAGDLPIYTCDLETDPFARGEVPVPFVAGLYDGVVFKNFWGKNCLEDLENYLASGILDPGIVYMHNGGRFDFFYLLTKFEGKTTIINSRIVVAKLPINDTSRRFERGHCFEFRDSFAIMPFPLASYRKDKLDINKLKRENREKHKEEILGYLKGDCVYLWELCMGFQREFGDYKTIASAAFAQLSKVHQYETLTKREDTELRERYYFGGRVQCFREGVTKLPVSIYDTNSMYPFVMSEFFHPTGHAATVDRSIHGWDLDAGTPTRDKGLKTFFLTVEGQNNGAFCQRMPDGSVEFTIPEGIFHVTIHEYLTATRLGLFKLERVHDSFSFLDYSKFHLFVSQYYNARKKVTAEFNEHKKTCAECGGHNSISATEGSAGYCPTGADLVAHNLYYKYILNSAYGKFGLNPENYSNWQITRTTEPPKGEGWTLEIISGKFFVWKQPSQISWNVKNIGTAASITGAARAYLLRAIAKSTDVIYCDTDSIICGEFAQAPDVPVDSKALGAWKAEGAGVLTAIAGKKMYAVFDDKGECIKHANKGAQISPDDIYSVAKGELMIYERDAPTFKMDGSAQFMHRTVRQTTKNIHKAPHV